MCKEGGFFGRSKQNGSRWKQHSNSFWNKVSGFRFRSLSGGFPKIINSIIIIISLRIIRDEKTDETETENGNGKNIRLRAYQSFVEKKNILLKERKEKKNYYSEQYSWWIFENHHQPLPPQNPFIFFLISFFFNFEHSNQNNKGRNSQTNVRWETFEFNAKHSKFFLFTSKTLSSSSSPEKHQMKVRKNKQTNNSIIVVHDHHQPTQPWTEFSNEKK